MTDELQARKDAATTHMVKGVIPNTTNHYDTLFGGTLLSWMDEVAFIAATRFGRCRFVTVSVDRTDFKHPIPSGTIVELIARIGDVGKSSIKVEVEVCVESMFSDDRLEAVTGLFTMVAIDEHKRPVDIRR